MRYIIIFILSIIFCANNVFAQKKMIQKDSLSNQLKEVVIIGAKKQQHNFIGKKQVKIGTSQIIKNPTNLTDLLRYNSPIALRDYGNGGISTARFRGTSASNTAVLWNGISINAIGSGQTDFNSLSASISDEIIVNSGGDSVESGSGAIGGTVELKDNLTFNEHKDFHLFSSYGSFNTTSNFFKTNIGTGKWALKFASTVNYSDNDYTFIDQRYKNNDGSLLKNDNGVYKNYGLNFSLGYQFSHKNKLYFYSTGYYGDRLFSDGLPNPAAGSERNEDFNQRNLLKWKYSFSNFTQTLNVAYLMQEYRYYDDKNAEEFTFGKSKNYNINYNLKYRFSNYLKISSSFIYDSNNGTTNEIIARERTFFAALAKVTYKPSERLTIATSVRKELNSDFKVPLVVSAAAEQEITDNLILKTNISTNYRVPTFNELYWPIVGNLDLKPESSIQGEIGASYKKKNIEITTSLFYIHLNDKILWLPTAASNLWRPRNVGDVVHQGIETFMNLSKEIGAHFFNFTMNYTFTLAKNKETDTFLPFAPKQLMNFNLDYTYKKATFFVQNLYQSKVYTNEINIDFYSLNALSVTNIGADFEVYQHNHKKLLIGIKVNNIFNEVYYFSNLRPMPGSNFNMNINYKF
ncbi:MULTISPECIES: TonB-dependent receptor plug domain-containing protein [unclassified Polaribacter]|uniref:TonB-dependent receptor plug domain-containing protein n=1 Tax=unclassified Polaribacter TaxID=196858 RepID=UPI0016751FEF|nr:MULTISPECIES: TonB-dependent receptor [unclassified Polaribacter]